MNHKYRGTIAFDFDGVIHYYDGYWRGDTVITGGPVFGIRSILNSLIGQEYRLIIISSRAMTDEGAQAIKDWLIKHKLDVFDEITAIKKPALVYIDDRAIGFKDSPKLFKDLCRYKDIYLNKFVYKKSIKEECESAELLEDL